MLTRGAIFGALDGFESEPTESTTEIDLRLDGRLLRHRHRHAARAAAAGHGDIPRGPRASSALGPQQQAEEAFGTGGGGLGILLREQHLAELALQHQVCACARDDLDAHRTHTHAHAGVTSE